MSQTEIARQVGCAQSTISKILKREKVKPGRGKGHRGKGNNTQKIVRIANYLLLNPGASPAEISDAVMIPELTIYRYLRDYFTKIIWGIMEAGVITENMIRSLELHELEMLGITGIYKVEDARAVALGGFRRWRECTRGAYGIAESILKGKYYRTAGYLLRLLNRFMSPETRRDAIFTFRDPGRIMHPVPNGAGVKRLFRPGGAERAARAQARQHRAGEVIVPSPVVFGAYRLMLSEKPCEKRDQKITHMLAGVEYYVISADMTVEDAIINKIFQLKDIAIWMKVGSEYDIAIRSAKHGAFLRGKKALRGLVRKSVTSFVGWAWMLAGCPGLPGAVDPAAARQRTEEEIAAARDFFEAVGGRM